MSGAKKLAAAGLMILGIRLALLGGEGANIGEWLKELSGNGRLVSASISLELGKQFDAAAETPSPTDTAEAVQLIKEEDAETSPASIDGDEEIVETTIYSGLSIKNGTDLDIDIAALATEGPSLVLSTDEPQILIIHTHSSEAYTPDGQDSYTPSDPDRTEDTRYNVVRVGDELAAALESYGLSVIHDREIYDYPSYTGSYSRSGAAVAEYLAEYPSIAIVIDLHRDALGSGEVVYKTMAEVDGECSSQVMLLVGTGEGGLSHTNWEENLKLALYLQQAMNSEYPTLARPITVTPERYNQHLSAGSLLLEVGSSGNTLQEALCAVRLFANAAGPALIKLETSE